MLCTSQILCNVHLKKFITEVLMMIINFYEFLDAVVSSVSALLNYIN